MPERSTWDDPVDMPRDADAAVGQDAGPDEEPGVVPSALPDPDVELDPDAADTIARLDAEFVALGPDAADAAARTKRALLDSGEGTLDPDGRPILPDDVRVLKGVDEDDWTGPTGS